MLDEAKEREAFEAFARDAWEFCSLSRYGGRAEDDMPYHDHDIQCAWQTWKFARARIDEGRGEPGNVRIVCDVCDGKGIISVVDDYDDEGRSIYAPEGCPECEGRLYVERTAYAATPANATGEVEKAREVVLVAVRAWRMAAMLNAAALLTGRRSHEKYREEEDGVCRLLNDVRVADDALRDVEAAARKAAP